MNKFIASTALAGSALVGGLLLGPSLAVAQDEPAPAEDVQDDTLEEGTVQDGAEDGRRGHRGFRAQRSEVLAELGLDSDTVRAGLTAGETLADIAEANGVDRDTLVGALVDAAEARIDAKVAAGDLTEEEAAEKAAAITERIETKVDTVRDGEGRRGQRGDADAGAEADAETEAEGETAAAEDTLGS